MAEEHFLLRNTTATEAIVSRKTEKLASNHNGPVTSFLDFGHIECQVMSYCYFLLSILGSGINLTIAVVLVAKIKRCIPKNPSDLLMVSLSIICLSACAILFPFEAFNCNANDSDLVFWFTFFLEVSSTIAMLSIAVNRYVLICKVGLMDFTFKAAAALCLVNLVISLVCSTTAMYFNSVAMMVYISVIVLILVTMIALYSLCYRALRVRATQSRNRSRNTATNIIDTNNSSIQNPVPHTQQLRPSVCTGSSLLMTATKVDVSGVFKETEHAVSGPCKPESEEPASNVNRGSGVATRESEEHANDSNPSTNKTQMESMSERSAKVFATITFVYILCFIPNVILTTLLFFIGPEFFITKRHDLLEILMRYANSLFNVNFIVTPVIYAMLSPQFARDFKNFLKRFQRDVCGSLNPQSQA